MVEVFTMKQGKHLCLLSYPRGPCLGSRMDCYSICTKCIHPRKPAEKGLDHPGGWDFCFLSVAVIQYLNQKATQGREEVCMSHNFRLALNNSREVKAGNCMSLHPLLNASCFWFAFVQRAFFRSRPREFCCPQETGSSYINILSRQSPTDRPM